MEDRRNRTMISSEMPAFLRRSISSEVSAKESALNNRRNIEKSNPVTMILIFIDFTPK